MKIVFMMKRAGAACLALLAGIGLFLACPGQAIQVQAAAKPAVVVLDPGHGGGASEDLGAIKAPYVEKAMTMYVSFLTKAELEQYSNVKVFLTRTDDYYVSLAQRAEYARSVGADLFVSQHFNMSSGQKSGAEVYVSVDPVMQQQGGSLAQLVLQQLNGQGLPVRGIYARSGLHGNYYGVIRRSTSYSIPSVIIEHCYMDNANDRAWLSDPNCYAKLAHADATAIAQYLHLKSPSLGQDFTNTARPGYTVIPMNGSGTIGAAAAAGGPQISNIGQVIAYGNGRAQITMYCVDTTYGISQFCYSTDGGATWSAPVSYGNSNAVWVTDITASRGQQVVIKAYNSKGESKISNTVTVK